MNVLRESLILARYSVTLRFQFPAWDERDGIIFSDIEAPSKAGAIAQARRQARRDGHVPITGKGRATFTAQREE